MMMVMMIIFVHSIDMCRMLRFLAVQGSFFHSSLSCTFPFHPSSLHFAIYFLVYLSASLFPNSYVILILVILFPSIICTCPNHRYLNKDRPTDVTCFIFAQHVSNASTIHLQVLAIVCGFTAL